MTRGFRKGIACAAILCLIGGGLPLARAGELPKELAGWTGEVVVDKQADSAAQLDTVEEFSRRCYPYGSTNFCLLAYAAPVPSKCHCISTDRSVKDGIVQR